MKCSNTTFCHRVLHMAPYRGNIHARIQEFFSGGGGSRPDGQETVWTTFFFFFLVLSLFRSLQRGSNGFFTEKTILYQGSRGGPTFSRGVQLFSRGVQMLISIETHITYDIPEEGSGHPIPPSGSALDIPPPPPPPPLKIIFILGQNFFIS